MEQFYKIVEKNGCKTDLTLENAKTLLPQGEFRFILQQINNRATVHLACHLDDEQISRVTPVLKNLHRSTKIFVLYCGEVGLPVARYFLLGGTLHTNLEKITIVNGDLHEYTTAAQNLQPRAPHINQLTFRRITINEAALPKLSTDFLLWISWSLVNAYLWVPLAISTS